MREEPDRPTPNSERRVYLSASNHLLLGLKTFGYMLIGYLVVGVVIAAVLAAMFLVRG